MIYLDTHVVVWLFAGKLDNFSKEALVLIDEQDIYISPTVRLELQYLHEIKRINVGSDEIIADLAERLGLRICSKDFNSIISSALQASWTSDPFDRLISAHAGLNDSILITKDQSILENYARALG